MIGSRFTSHGSVGRMSRGVVGSRQGKFNSHGEKVESMEAKERECLERKGETLGSVNAVMEVDAMNLISPRANGSS